MNFLPSFLWLGCTGLLSFAEHGKSSPLVADAPVEVQPDELRLSFQMQQQAGFDACCYALGPDILPSPGGEAVHISPLVFLILHIRSAQYTGRSP